MTNSNAPLGTRFTVLVVPGDHVISGGPTIPKVVRSADATSPWIAVAAEAGPKHVEAAPWAFGGRSKASVIRQLRDLADWLEKN